MQTPEQRVAAVATQPMLSATQRSGALLGTVGAVRDIWNRRQLLHLLVKRELKSRYKDSTLGFLWSLLRPLALLLVYYLAIGKFLGGARATNEFAIYMYTGLTAWNLFAEVVGTGTASIVTNSGLVKKVYVPREIFPLAAIGSALFNFLIQLVILVVATLIAGQPPDSWLILYLPLSVLLILVWSTAFALLLSAVNVYLRDMQYLVEIVLMVGFWFTPVVYSYTQVSSNLNSHPLLLDIFTSNPITLAVMGFQRAMWVAERDPLPGTGPGTSSPAKYPIVLSHLDVRLTIALAVGVVFLWICQRAFARMQANFAQEL